MQTNKIYKPRKIYEPREDSFFLRDEIKNYADKHIKGKRKLRALDIGTGSGILAEEAAKYCDEVLAVDINPEVVEHAKLSIKNSNISFRLSNLFLNVLGKFDLIIFNPPYLPNHPKLKDIALDGGKKGYELVQRFIEEASDYLTSNGKILLLISSFTKKASVERIMKKNNFNFEIVGEKKLDFEKLYVYIMKKAKKAKKAKSKTKTG